MSSPTTLSSLPPITTPPVAEPPIISRSDTSYEDIHLLPTPQQNFMIIFMKLLEEAISNLDNITG